MPRTVSQRELRNDSGRIMRQLDAGQRFVVTRNGVAVAELVPLRPRTFVPAEAARAVFARAGRVDFKRLRRDLDAVADQDPTPRG
jgi:antitoxin (DNA-binding transcriptional repressor) of toxin-antitoxin stability system